MFGCSMKAKHPKENSWTSRLQWYRSNRHDLCEDRTRAFKPKIGNRDHMTILRKIHIVMVIGARQIGRTLRMHSTAEERERW